jgi:hypothetical protein
VWYRKLRPYKYQTLAEMTYETGWHSVKSIASEQGWVHLSDTGKLTIQRGYCWDGASGPTFDTASTMRASLIHDALYQLMRERKLTLDWRPLADECLRRIMVADYRGRWPKWHLFRVSCWVWALKRFARYAAEPEG